MIVILHLKHPIIGTTEEIFQHSDNGQTKPEEPKKSKPKEMQNLLFYLNKIPSRPQGDLIENILKNW